MSSVWFAAGFAMASVLWALAGLLAWRRHVDHVQAALNLPRASSRADLKQQLAHLRTKR